MGDITGLLERWAEGDREAFERLVPLVYDELRALAGHYLKNERDDHTLEPNALVHEAYLRMAGIHMRLENRLHFFGAAAGVMRRILVDHARQKRARKRNAVTSIPVLASPSVIDLRADFIALDSAIGELEQIAPRQARVVELRYFSGLSIEETGRFLGVAPATVKRHWAFARAWLFRRLTES